MLKEAVFEPDTPTTNEKLATPDSAPVDTSNLAIGTTNSAANAANNSMVTHMMEIVMNKTTAYTALIEAITPLENYIQDEGMRYKAAFAIVGKTRTIEQIIQAIDMQHMQALEAEVQRFSTQARSKENEDVNSRIGQVDLLRKEVVSSNEEIERIKKHTEDRIRALQEGAVAKTQRIVAMEKEIADQREVIAKVNGQFNESVDIVRQRLTIAKADVNRYLAS